MKENELVPGCHYWLDDKEVEFAYIGQTGYAIVHPPGDPDMQSSSAVKPEQLKPFGFTSPIPPPANQDAFDLLSED